MKLDKEHTEMDLLNLFHTANSLHTNFYENWPTSEAMIKRPEAVRGFVEKPIEGKTPETSMPASKMEGKPGFEYHLLTA